MNTTPTPNLLLVRLMLERRLNKLHPISKQMITLYYFDGLSIDEISDELLIAPSICQSILKQAHLELRLMLKPIKDTLLLLVA